MARVAQVVGSLPSKCKALSSNLSTTKKCSSTFLFKWSILIIKRYTKKIITNKIKAHPNYCAMYSPAINLVYIILTTLLLSNIAKSSFGKNKSYHPD
jgi:hypothetical protein